MVDPTPPHNTLDAMLGSQEHREFLRSQYALLICGRGLVPFITHNLTQWFDDEVAARAHAIAADPASLLTELPDLAARLEYARPRVTAEFVRAELGKLGLRAETGTFKRAIEARLANESDSVGLLP